MHPGNHRARQHARSEDQRAVRTLPLFRLVLERAAERWPAGVGDQDLDRPERRLDLTGQLGEPLEVGGVGNEGCGLAADLRSRRLDPLL